MLRINYLCTSISISPLYNVINVRRLFKMEKNAAENRVDQGRRTFLYFAYGSNLLKERILINNKSAVFKAVGHIQDWELTFAMFSQRWQGHVATILPVQRAQCWGVVWELDISDKQNLDNQEGVSRMVYKPIEVQVTCEDGSILECRTYELLRPLERGLGPPSPQYKNVIVSGARQNGLPQDYIAQLEAIEDNGYSGTLDITSSLIKNTDN
ncbi:gamma-glutamylcyclotransferase [Lingula anatina]|uniref:gamma-glutamylcyclotransferase n=1 Tax=Lingula anatina TaxID=7574 RepID=A0A1S3J4F8_LINAN|nr:gamma-glutamylcyclotransferase [Lingula anatina]|eukprot:XP_013405270.1 gamma-glutamylcyclotransferase [Lingula anatina]